MAPIGGQAKKLSRKMESDNAAAAVLVVTAASNDAFDNKENVVRGVPLADNHRIATVTDGAAPQRQNAVLYRLLAAVTQERLRKAKCSSLPNFAGPLAIRVRYNSVHSSPPRQGRL